MDRCPTRSVNGEETGRGGPWAGSPASAQENRLESARRKSIERSADSDSVADRKAHAGRILSRRPVREMRRRRRHRRFNGREAETSPAGSAIREDRCRDRGRLARGTSSSDPETLPNPGSRQAADPARANMAAPLAAKARPADSRLGRCVSEVRPGRRAAAQTVRYRSRISGCSRSSSVAPECLISPFSMMWQRSLRSSTNDRFCSARMMESPASFRRRT